MPDCFVANLATKKFSCARNHFPIGVEKSGNGGSLTICPTKRCKKRRHRESVMPNVIAINDAARQGIIAAQATSDEMLLESIADGGRTAMHILYSRHNVRVFRFVLRIVRDTTMAEDLVSQVFLDVWRTASQFEGRSQVSTWLLSIAR